MLESADDLASIARLIEALRPWLGQVVLVGGWAHRLYRLDARATVPAYAALRTRDADIAIGEWQQFQGSMAEALRQAGFKEELSGDHQPPVSQYSLGAEDQGFYAEFLTPLTGSAVRRGGRTDATVEVGGITAQKLKHLDLLLLRPWSVRLEPAPSLRLTAAADLRLPSPVTFIAQKLLISPERSRAKRAQDALYIHDTLELFGDGLDQLLAEWRDVVVPAIQPVTRTAIERMGREQFGAVTDVIRSAARIPVDRALEPEPVRAVCEYGLKEIFGSGG
jgi:Nucleotidyltransferase